MGGIRAPLTPDTVWYPPIPEIEFPPITGMEFRNLAIWSFKLLWAEATPPKAERTSFITVLVRAFKSRGCWPSKMKSTFSMGSPKVLVTIQDLEINLGADLYLEVKLAGYLERITAGSWHTNSLLFSTAKIVRKSH